ncbi:MAG: gliding motility protein GldL [Muribaculaceae bacterium]|nr:gliding motility protein GldL [Muribaculaceae bacterium]
MGKVKRYKKKAGRFLKSDSGQRFFNFAYSIGAAIVIWGALFKILHLPGGNTLLCIGMGTEVLMFILTAFDKPEKEYHWEEVFPVLASKDPEDRPDFAGGGGIIIGGAGGSGEGDINVSVAEAKNAVGLPQGVNLSEEDTMSLSESIAKMAAASDQLSRMAELTDATQQYLSQMAGISEQMKKLQETTTALNDVSQTLLGSYRAITDNSQNITESSTGYVDQMQALNQNISGLNTIYEIQLKSISSQLENIDRVNRGLKDIRDMYEKSAAESAHYCDETEKMARYMKQLNSVYEKMVKAMTVNMYRPMPGMPGIDPDANDQDA